MGHYFAFSIFLAISGSCLLGAQEIIQIPTATDRYQLSYSLDIPNSNITFEIIAETKGFVGFGFSNISGMISSDIFIGGVNEDGTTYFGDYSSASVGTPRLDAEQNWELLQGSETETTTYLQFRRSFVTSDQADINITDSLMNIIWALGEDDTLRYHGFSRSNLKFNLISGTNGGEEPEPPPTQATTTTTTTTTTPIPPTPIQIPLGSDLIQVRYTISGDDIITFVATAKTTGFIGFGFSNETGMTNSDIFIAGVNDTDSQPYSGDYNSRGYVPPNLDDEQDWTFISGSQTGDETTVTFSRPLITSDFENDVPIEDKEMQVIWALGTTDTLAYHGNRGSTAFNLIPNTDSSTEPSETTTLETQSSTPETTTLEIETTPQQTTEPPQTTTPETETAPQETTTPETTTPETTTPETTSQETTPEPSTTPEGDLPGNGEIPLGTDQLKVTYSIVGESIIFVATAQTTGYVGFGFSNSSGMFPADVFIGGVADDGEIYFGDYKTTAKATPERDSQQDWTLIYGQESRGETMLIFSRLFNTQDLENDIVIEDKVMTIIWALGSSDNLAYHGSTRGNISYNLIAGQAPTPTTPRPTTTTPPPPTTTEAVTPGPGNGEIPLGTDLLKMTYSILGDNVMFVATAQTTGYVGFGFSESGGMFPADIFIGGVRDNGDTYFGDYKSTARILPSRDPQQDWILLYGSEAGNQTILVFSRLLDTNDPINDLVIENKTMAMIWALGSSDDITYHGSTRGNASYNLIEGQAPPPTPPPTITTQDPGTNPTEQPPGNGEIPMGTNLIRVTFTKEENTFTFTVVAKTLGWVGFGFSNTTGMENADIFIAGVDGGREYSKDYVARGTGHPDEDTSQDWELISASEAEGSTTIVFSRLLDTEDALEDIKIEDKKMSIIWAIGSSDTIDYHGGTNRGNTSYNLIEAPAILPPMDPLPKSIPFEGDLIQVTYEIQGDNITFQVIGQTMGFIGFGVSNGTGSDSGMKSSDIFIAWVNSEGAEFMDTFSIDEVAPQNDTESNWELISGEEGGGFTRLVFTRLLVTEDKEQDIPIEDKYMRVIWAMGVDDVITYHGETNRGKLDSFNFFEKDTTEPSSGWKLGSWMLLNGFAVLIAIICM